MFNNSIVLFILLDLQQQSFTLFLCSECFRGSDEGDVLANLVVMGWLSQRRQFGVVAVDDSLRKLAMHCPCDGAIATTNFETL